MTFQLWFINILIFNYTVINGMVFIKSYGRVVLQVRTFGAGNAMKF